MNVLEKWKARLTDKRLEEQKAEHDREIEYLVTQNQRRLEVVTGERDAAYRELKRLLSNMKVLLQSHGGDNGTSHEP
jgi:iron-sulfur cluster repair protein YtfE (RIC family)